jgi:Tol biopolymer transport system component/DNA-binding winged helix-turn-helix (wHTH) protein
VPAQIIRLADFDLDLGRYQLRRGDRVVKLEKNPMELLILLVEKQGELVTREEIIRRLWGDNVFVDTRHGINTAVHKLRSALRDDSERPRILETVVGKGYRLVAGIAATSAKDHLFETADWGSCAGRPNGQNAVVQVLETESNGSSGDEATVLRWRLAVQRWVPLGIALAAGLALLVIVASVAMLEGRYKSPPNVRAFDVVQLTNDGQVKYDPLATDGTRIYTSEFWTGRRGVLVQVPLKGGQPVPIVTSLKDPRFFDVSPNGTELLVGNHEELARFSLWVLSVTGTVSRQIGEVQADDDAAWMPNGKDVVYSHGRQVYLVGTDGSSPRKLFSAPGQVSHIRFSPDGSVVRFTLREMEKKTQSLWQASPLGEHAHQLLPNWRGHTSECCGDWTRDGRYYIFQSAHEGRTDLWLLPNKTKFPWSRDSEPQRLTGGPLDFSRPLPANDPGTIFAVGSLNRSEIVRYDVHAKAYVPYLFGASAEFVSFSKDAGWFAYSSYPNATLWRSRMEGTHKLQLTFPPMRAYAPRWSPDGKSIAFMGSMPGKSWNIYTIPADGGTPEQVLPEEQNQADPNWASDGDSIAFGGMGMEIDNVPIRILDLKSKHVSTLPRSEKFFSPRSSPAGRYVIALTRRRPYRLMLFDSQTSKWTELPGDEASYPEWSRDGKYVYFRTPQSVARVRISDHKIENLVDLTSIGRLPIGTFGYWFGIAPDDSPLLARDISTQEIYAIKWVYGR